MNTPGTRSVSTWKWLVLDAQRKGSLAMLQSASADYSLDSEQPHTTNDEPTKEKLKYLKSNPPRREIAVTEKGIVPRSQKDAGSACANAVQPCPSARTGGGRAQGRLIREGDHPGCTSAARKLGETR